jgi:hypothetical protein
LTVWRWSASRDSSAYSRSTGAHQLLTQEFVLDSDGPFTFDSRSGVTVYKDIFMGRFVVFSGGLKVLSQLLYSLSVPPKVTGEGLRVGLIRVIIVAHLWNLWQKI